MTTFSDLGLVLLVEIATAVVTVVVLRHVSTARLARRAARTNTTGGHHASR